ncbi:hypothetical protein EVAR_28829_1 [Eumeta japonica]|uniref:Retrovirus-related Pol polyprotein from transposon 297 n=1 Tax=Eumeta variegata TaxID=151549 RepID=A0A4C1WKG1_EUMVA|nr:hypothetical protein EVAR_28829_1 [Eumeta japonica]
MHLPSELRARRRAMADAYDLNWLQTIIEDTRSEHPDLGKVKKHEACIDLQVEKYCYKRPYRCSPQDKIEIEDQIVQLLKHELIEESYSPFAAPVTLAFKRDEEPFAFEPKNLLTTKPMKLDESVISLERRKGTNSCTYIPTQIYLFVVRAVG